MNRLARSGFLLFLPLFAGTAFSQSTAADKIAARQRILANIKIETAQEARPDAGAYSTALRRVVALGDVNVSFPATSVNSTSTKDCYYNCFLRSGSPSGACDFGGTIAVVKQVGPPFRVTNLRRGIANSGCGGTPVSLPVTLNAGEWLLQDFQFTPTFNGSFSDSHDYNMTPTNSPTGRFSWGLSGATPTATDPCTPKAISIPTTLQGNLTTVSCYDPVLNAVEDIYTINGVAGQTVTIDYTSSAYETFLWMEGVTVQHVSLLPSGVSRERIVYTFPTTKSYKLEAESLYGPGEGQVYTGAYTLAITVGNSTPPPSNTCVQNSTTLCLNSDRFAVTSTYRTSGGQTGSGQAVRLTGDTGYFWFFGSSNVEVVIKVIDGCGLSRTFWVFAGGLTDVNVVLTVRDTHTNQVRTYTNTLGIAFQPIQDTSAFSTCNQ